MREYVNFNIMYNNFFFRKKLEKNDKEFSFCQQYI